jgi:hypothetical protein
LSSFGHASTSIKIVLDPSLVIGDGPPERGQVA